MWGKATEVGRLIELRQEARKQLAGGAPLRASISLVLEVHIGPRNSRAVGDLDNFVTGVCDGLQARVHSSGLHPDWRLVDPGIHPDQCVAIWDDNAILSIYATKVVALEAPYYVVELTGA